MVSSLDGKATTGGKAGSIGSPTDRLLMRTLRARADAVMIGAGTLRAEKLRLDVPENLAQARQARGLKPQPLAVLVTATGDLRLETNLLGSRSDNLLVLVSPETPEEGLDDLLASQASVEVVPSEAVTNQEEFDSSEPGPGLRLDPKKALETLKKRHAVDVLLVEGGPFLNHALVRDALVDELLLTLAPKLLGSTRPDASTIIEGPPFLPPLEVEAKLISVYLSGSELFLRYALQPPGEG